MHCRAADSTGIKVEGEGEWHASKHGGAKRRVWRKIHLGIDEETLEIRAVEITGSHVGPSRQHAAHAPAGQWMRRSFLTSSTKSQRAKSSPASRQTAPTTRASATMRSQIAVPMPSFHPARTRSPGRLSRLEAHHFIMRQRVGDDLGAGVLTYETRAVILLTDTRKKVGVRLAPCERYRRTFSSDRGPSHASLRPAGQ